MRIIAFIFLLMTTLLYSQIIHKTQLGTGPGNCGPTCVAMAIEYSTGEKVTVEAVRQAMGGYVRSDGSTSIEDLIEVLGKYGIEFNLLYEHQLQLDEAVYIMLVDTTFLTERKYSYAGGHYILISKSYVFHYVVQDPLLEDETIYRVDRVRAALKAFPIIEIMRNEN